MTNADDQPLNPDLSQPDQPQPDQPHPDQPQPPAPPAPPTPPIPVDDAAAASPYAPAYSAGENAAPAAVALPPYGAAQSPPPYGAPPASGTTPTGFPAPPAYGTAAPDASGAQPYAYAQAVAGPPRGLSVASMICGIAGVVFAVLSFGFLPAVAGVVLGHIAKRRQPYARPFWLTGLITGYVGVAIAVLQVGLVIAFIVWGIVDSGTTSGDFS
jgi:hypothetical protein